MKNPLFKNLAKMATAPIRERGLLETVRSVRGCLHARRRERIEAFDRRFGTDTNRHVSMNELRAIGPDVPALWRYWPTLEAPFHRLMDAADLQPEQSVFVDLGSGKGRVLLMASDRPFRRIIGVELSPALHRVAERNIQIYRSLRQRCFDFELACMDAALFEPPAENTTYYLFQPFPEATMAKVLNNIRDSLHRNPRRMVLAYMNPLFHQLVIDTGVFALQAKGEPNGPGEFDWAVYTSRI